MPERAVVSGQWRLNQKVLPVSVGEVRQSSAIPAAIFSPVPPHGWDVTPRRRGPGACRVSVADLDVDRAFGSLDRQLDVTLAVEHPAGHEFAGQQSRLSTVSVGQPSADPADVGAGSARRLQPRRQHRGGEQSERPGCGHGHLVCRTENPWNRS